jgi:hypothetical protein
MHVVHPVSEWCCNVHFFLPSHIDGQQASVCAQYNIPGTVGVVFQKRSFELSETFGKHGDAVYISFWLGFFGVYWLELFLKADTLLRIAHAVCRDGRLCVAGAAGYCRPLFVFKAV